MQGSHWIRLFRRIPEELHNTLALGLVTGEEIVVQQLIRMEGEFVIIRGRMSGSTAEGRIMLVPYAQLTLVALNKPLVESEVQAIFGQSESGASAPAVSSAPAVDREPPMPPDAAQAPSAAPKLLKPPSKSVLLARLRERLAEKAR